MTALRIFGIITHDSRLSTSVQVGQTITALQVKKEYDRMFRMAKPLTFLNEVKVELSKVIWPTRKEVIRLTLIVIAVSIVVGFFIGGVDYVLTKLTEIALKR